MQPKLAEKLQKYLDDTGVKKGYLAKKAGFTSLTLRNIMNGRLISLEVALKLQKATNNYITIEDAGFKKEDYGLS